METQSVIQIKNLRDKIKEKLASFDSSQFNNTKFGDENEYNGKSLYLGLDSLLVDISYFIRAHNIFIQNTTLEERNSIINQLTNIHSYIESPQNLFRSIDILKIELRKHNIRSNIERWELFQDVNKELLEQRDEFKVALQFINEIKDQAKNSNSTITEKIEALTKTFEELEEKIEEVEEVKTEIVTNSENLKTINSALL